MGGSISRTILFSGYRCDPYDVSEANIAFKWLTILLKRFNVILLTTNKACSSIDRFFAHKLPGNLEIIPFKDNYPFRSKRIVRDSIKLGYFFFNYRITTYLRKNPKVISNVDLIFQKSPASYRYFTTLYQFDKPLYIGPLSGGLKPPASLKKYFRKEHFLYRLRFLDSLLLKLPVYRKQFLKAEKIIVSFDYLHELIPSEYLKRKKILLDIGIDSSKYPPARYENRTLNLLYVGRLTRYKGPEILIKAVKDLKGIDFILNILGEGEEEYHLKKLVDEFDLRSKVVFHGFRNAEEVKEFYSKASIFCAPAITESIGIVYFEAMASGLPIIAVNNGGPQFICPDQGAIKIPVKTEQEIIREFRDSILILATNPEKRRKMGEFNRKYCIKNYDWKILEKNILHFFEEEVVRIDPMHSF